MFSGGTPDRSRGELWSGEIPWLSAKDLKGFYASDSLEKVTALGSKSGTRLVPAGTILILVRGMTLLKDVPVALATTSITFNQDLKALRPGTGIVSAYLAYWLVFQRHTLKSMVDQSGHGTGRLPSELLRTLPVWLPPLPVQTRIARILGAWDKAITEMLKLIEAKRQLRKALSQRFFDDRGSQGVVADNTCCGGEHDSPRPASKLGEFFRQRREKGYEGLPLLSVTMARGVIRRDSVDRKLETSLDSEEHQLVKRGDIVYNMMRMWQGAFGVAEEEGIVSPAYVVCAAKNGIIPGFVGHLLRHSKMMKKLSDYSYGLTGDRLRLYYKDFAKIPVQIPPIEEQRRIAAVLDTVDREIELLTRQADALKLQKKGLMQKLLTGQIRVKT
jgi:type I restriction enzyme S subunit